MKVGLYAGSFNPWHKGHQDILDKALEVFDKVIVARFTNFSKKNKVLYKLPKFDDNRIKVISCSNTLVEIVNDLEIDAVIRGLRSGNDFSNESIQQSWYEDLGLKKPIVYFISDRSVRHYSSSAVRELIRVKSKKDKESK